MSSVPLRILFLTTVLPRERRMGSEVASQAIIDALRSKGHRVDVMGYSRRDSPLDAGTGEICVGRRHIESRNSMSQAAGWLLSSLVRNLPYSATKFFSRAYVDQVGSLVTTDRYHVIVIDHSQLAWLLGPVSRGGAPLVGIAHNIEHETYGELAWRAREPMRRIYQREARLIERCERALARHAKEVWVFTPHDARFYTSIGGPGRVRVLSLPSNVVPMGREPVEKLFDIALIGSWSWKANDEGLRWFLAEIYPLLPKEVSIQIGGSGANWLNGRYPNVTYHGFVPDSRRFLMQARVVAIPTISGGGIQLKTLDAIAAGTCVVGTVLAGRGIVEPPQFLTVTDQPDRFASELLNAIARTEVTSLRQEALVWTHRREERFYGEIDSWIRAAAETRD